jgi:hypothetical protein
LDSDGVVAGGYAADGVLPVEANTEAGGAVEQKRMQQGAADSATGVCGEGGLDGDVVVGGGGVADESYAAQEDTFDWVEVTPQIEAESGEGFERGGKKALSTGFVDGRRGRIDDIDLKTVTSGGDGRGQTGWSCSDDTDFTLI